MSTAPSSYSTLYSRALEVVRQLGASTWTDHNAHDPGITILEQLTYALTDLQYRAGFPVADLLADPPGEPGLPPFPSPRQILHSDPVTVLDYRRLAMDVDGVRNAWIEPVTHFQTPLYSDSAEQNTLYLEGVPHRPPLLLRGVYRVLLETETSGPSDVEIIAKVQDVLMAHRQLGWDFEKPVVLRHDPIVLEAEFEHAESAEPADILRQLLEAAADYLAPRLRFYSLDEMLARGRTVTEIFSGPALQHGFLDEQELAEFNPREGLRTSDLTRLFMAIPGMTAVRRLHLVRGNVPESWHLPILPDTSPELDLQTSLFSGKIRLRRGRVLWNPSREELEDLRAQVLTRRTKQAPRGDHELDLPVDAGRFRDPGHHTSILQHLPGCYGVGQMGLPAGASLERVAQARQLKAYLFLLDQILASVFAQLAHARSLLRSPEEDLPSYGSRLPEEIPDPSGIPGKITTEWLGKATETVTQARQRRSRFLNHLLSRYGESGSDFDRIGTGLAERNRAKARFVQQYPAMSQARGSGMDVSTSLDEALGQGGLAEFIARKLGLDWPPSLPLASMKPRDPGGFYLVEHLLLRPCQADLQACLKDSRAPASNKAFLGAPGLADPYSARISIVLTGWTIPLLGLAALPSTSSADETGSAALKIAREQIANLILDVVPAHFSARLVWIETPKEMAEFESAYRTFREALRAPGGEGLRSTAGRDARDRLALALELGTPYPIRDLELLYPSMAALDLPAEILIRGAQAGVEYRLCDEEGNLLTQDSNTANPDQPYAVDSWTAEGGILHTPPITEDVTFTVLATRVDQAKQRFETYLASTIDLRAGINDALDVRARAKEGQEPRPDRRLRISYRDTVTVEIARSQEGILYELVDAKAPNEIRSNSVAGDKASIRLESTPIEEDVVLAVRATRIGDPGTAMVLQQTVGVAPLPNPNILWSTESSVADDGATLSVRIADPQATVEYSLYQHTLLPEEWITNEFVPQGRTTPGTRREVAFPIENGRMARLWVPTLESGLPDSSFTQLAVFKKQRAALAATTGALRDDTLFVVVATKKESGETLVLSHLEAVFVRPKPECPLSARPEKVHSGSSAAVWLAKTQPWVRYSLRQANSSELLGSPGFHHAERGLDYSRLGIDFEIEGVSERKLILPTPPLSVETEFKVVATKRLSQLALDLVGSVTIGIDDSAPETPPDPVAPASPTPSGPTGGPPPPPAPPASPTTSSPTSANDPTGPTPPPETPLPLHPEPPAPLLPLSPPMGEIVERPPAPIDPALPPAEVPAPSTGASGPLAETPTPPPATRGMPSTVRSASSSDSTEPSPKARKKPRKQP